MRKGTKGAFAPFEGGVKITEKTRTCESCNAAALRKIATTALDRIPKTLDMRMGMFIVEFRRFEQYTSTANRAKGGWHTLRAFRDCPT
jgi:hypothetical protein